MMKWLAERWFQFLRWEQGNAAAFRRYVRRHVVSDHHSAVLQSCNVFQDVEQFVHDSDAFCGVFIEEKCCERIDDDETDLKRVSHSVTNSAGFGSSWTYIAVDFALDKLLHHVNGADELSETQHTNKLNLL